MKNSIKKTLSFIAILLIGLGIQFSTIANASIVSGNTTTKQNFRYVKSYCSDGITTMTAPDGSSYGLIHYYPGWREITVIDSKWNVVSLGCKVSSTYNIPNLSTVTNGIIYENETAPSPGAEYASISQDDFSGPYASVTIDLGKVYSDISFIDVTYIWGGEQSRKLEVSVDGVNWLKIDEYRSSDIKHLIFH